MGAHQSLDFGGIVVRTLMCMFIVFATYNASGYSFYHWVESTGTEDLILKLMCAAALGFGFYFIIDISRRTLHRLGLSLVTAFCATSAWYVVDSGWVRVETREDVITAVQMTFVAIVTIGVCYSHYHYRISNLKQVEET